MRAATIVPAGALALLLAATPAIAIVKRATYTGSVIDGYDLTGEFGAPDTYLDGASYVASFRYDLDLAAVRFTAYDALDAIQGGSLHGLGSAMISATLRINGVTQQFKRPGLPDYTADVGVGRNLAAGATYHDFTQFVYFDAVNFTYQFLQLYSTIPVAVTSLDADLATATAPGDGGFQIFLGNPGVADHYASGNLRNATLTITTVPEPASWALMIAGFGLVGASLRQRRRIAA